MSRSTSTSSRASKRSAMPISSPAAARGSSLLRPSTSMMAAASDPLSSMVQALYPECNRKEIIRVVVDRNMKRVEKFELDIDLPSYETSNRLWEMASSG
ncbi:uncharacterized protein A4U43_C08F15330 [Asparagus officinalis]|nr:uncharacterized protein A4U43_C08F15330 [Asparagus officinalis]